MLRSTILLCSLALLASNALQFEEVSEEAKSLAGKQLIKYINAQKTTWQAQSYSRFEGKSHEELKQFLGALKKPTHMRRRGTQAKSITLADKPVSFSAKEAWPQCSGIIGLIQDQSACGSCWAVSTTSVMSDRLCIASNGSVQTHISALDLMACCGYCGYQCQGGYPDEAFYQFTYDGIVTGSNYTEDAGCKPYPIEPCVQDPISKNHTCPKEVKSKFKCKKSCQKSYKDETYKSDHYYGKQVKSFSNQNDAAIAELLKNGPLVAAFSVYEDFYKYKSGVYQYQAGKYVGGHAVRIVGYGTENGTDYWLVANSWDTFFGEGGYFKIKRGSNECGFDSEITTVDADISKSLKDK